MSVIKKMRKQKAVWWERNAAPDQFGQYGFQVPVEIDCRWDDVAMETHDTNGEIATSQGTLYPDRVLKAGDRVKRGNMDSGASDNPMEETDTFEVMRFDQIPNFRNTETLYVAYLFNYGRRQ